MTQIGKRSVELCSREKNCITSEQHDSCNRRDFYQSAKSQVIFDPFFSLKVRNFMSKNVAPIASHSEWDQGDFEEDSDDPFEETESKTPQHYSTKFQSKKDDICKICLKKFSNLLLHLSRWSEKCRNEYGDEFEEIKKRKEDEQRVKELKRKHDNYEQNKNDIKKKRRERFFQDGGAEKERNRQYKSRNAGWIAEKKRDIRRKAKSNRSKKDRFNYFNEDIVDGPKFVCFSCHRALFKKGVKFMKDEDILKLVDKLDDNSLKKIGLDSMENLTNRNLCHTCHNWMRKGKVPCIHVSNGLTLDEVSEELDLTNLEQQLIARNLIFLKVKKLPRSG